MWIDELVYDLDQMIVSCLQGEFDSVSGKELDFLFNGLQWGIT